MWARAKTKDADITWGPIRCVRACRGCGSAAGRGSSKRDVRNCQRPSSRRRLTWPPSVTSSVCRALPRAACPGACSLDHLRGQTPGVLSLPSSDICIDGLLEWPRKWYLLRRTRLTCIRQDPPLRRHPCRQDVDRSASPRWATEDEFATWHSRDLEAGEQWNSNGHSVCAGS